MARKQTKRTQTKKKQSRASAKKSQAKARQSRASSKKSGAKKRQPRKQPVKTAPRKEEQHETARHDRHQPFPPEIGGFFLIAIGGVTLLALMGLTKGAVSDTWVMLLRRIFGWGAWMIAPFLIAGGVALLFWRTLREQAVTPWRAIIGIELTFVAYHRHRTHFCGRPRA